jgi:hypothetical protein
MISPLQKAQLFKILHGKHIAFFPADVLIIEGKGHVFHGILEADEVK